MMIMVIITAVLIVVMILTEIEVIRKSAKRSVCSCALSNVCFHVAANGHLCSV
jgi:hypothetical protein